jgi:hypothetical protein
MLASIDYGHNSIKAGTENEKVYIESLVSDDVKNIQYLGSIKESYDWLNNLRIKFTQTGEEYFIGKQVRKAANNPVKNNYEGDFNSRKSKVLINTALSYLTKNNKDDNKEIDLLLTLPISSYFKYSEQMKNEYINKSIETELYYYPDKNYISSNFEINNVIIRPQGFTALMNYLLSEEGTIEENKREVAQKLITVVDVGWFSTDDYSIDNLNPLSSGENKINGIGDTYRKIANKINEKYDLSKKPFELEKLVRTKEIKVNGNVFNESDLLDIQFRNFAEDIYIELKNQLKHFNETDIFFITGGGSIHVKEYLEDMIENKTIISETPLFDNQEGGLKWLKRKLNQ